MTTRTPGKPWRKAAAAVVALAGLAFVPAAHAELWGFIDADGVAHFADQKLDARYKLFMRDGGKLDTGRWRRGSRRRPRARTSTWSSTSCTATSSTIPISRPSSR